MKTIKSFNEYLNEGVRDKMTPKPKEDVIKMLRDKTDVFMNAAKDKFMENELTRSISLGEMAQYQMKIKFGMSLVEYKFKKVTNYSVKAPSNELKPLVKESIEEWLKTEFPRWGASDISDFWEGFNDELEREIEGGRIRYVLTNGELVPVLEGVRDMMTPKSREEVHEIQLKNLSKLCMGEFAEIWVYGNDETKKKIEEHVYDEGGHDDIGSDNLFYLRKVIRSNYEKKDYIGTHLFQGESISESLRDKMTPKSKDDIKSNMMEYFKKYKLPGIPKVFDDLFVKYDIVYRVEYYDDYFHYINEYFKTITNLLDEEINKDSNKPSTYSYIYYPSIKVVEELEQGEEYSWYFNEDHIDSIIKYIMENQ